MPYCLGIMKRGRPKGYSPYTTISYEELGDWVGRKTKVVVCKKWLESLIDTPDEPKPEPLEESPQTSEAESKIQYNLTQF